MKLHLPRALFAAVFVSAGLFMAGCSVMNSVGGRFSQFHETATADGDEAVVYATARTVLEAMGYQYERGSPAGHRLEMATRVQPGSSAQLLRQRRVVLEFRAMGEQGTDVTVGFWEVSEEAEPGSASVAGGKLIRGGALYEAFWERLSDALPDKLENVPAPPEKGTMP